MSESFNRTCFSSPVTECEDRPDAYPDDPWANALFHDASDVLAYLAWREAFPDKPYVARASRDAIRRMVRRMAETVDPPAVAAPAPATCDVCKRMPADHDDLQYRACYLARAPLD